MSEKVQLAVLVSEDLLNQIRDEAHRVGCWPAQVVAIRLERDYRKCPSDIKKPQRKPRAAVEAEPAIKD